jgi:hypothetical protein
MCKLKMTFHSSAEEMWKNAVILEFFKTVSLIQTSQTPVTI